MIVMTPSFSLIVFGYQSEDILLFFLFRTLWELFMMTSLALLNVTSHLSSEEH